MKKLPSHHENKRLHNSAQLIAQTVESRNRKTHRHGKTPTVMGKPVGIVRKTIYNNHGTEFKRWRRRSIQKPYISKTAYVSAKCRIPKFPL